MINLLISATLLDWIQNECIKFQERTNYEHPVEVYDVLYSLLNSTDDSFCIYNDWDEGKNNDPFWNEEKDEHSAIVFLEEICKEIKKEY